MAITFSVPLGSPLAIAQNAVLALPPATVQLLALAAVEVSVDGTTWVALTGSATISGVPTGATFVRCTTAGTTIVCKRID